MKTAEVRYSEETTSITLPEEFRFLGCKVLIRKEGEAIVFENIQIDDTAFVRPPQGLTPPISTLDDKQ